SRLPRSGWRVTFPSCSISRYSSHRSQCAALPSIFSAVPREAPTPRFGGYAIRCFKSPARAPLTINRTTKSAWGHEQACWRTRRDGESNTVTGRNRRQCSERAVSAKTRPKANLKTLGSCTSHHAQYRVRSLSSRSPAIEVVGQPQRQARPQVHDDHAEDDH